MMTVKHIERLWTAKRFSHLLGAMLAGRAEAGLPVIEALARSAETLAPAAMAIVRLDELNQSHTPLYARLVRHLLTQQSADGGWGDAMTTALCIRALRCGRGRGDAIDRGLQYLANLQRDDGGWPDVPLRRFPSEGLTTAFVLLQLAGDGPANEVVRIDDAADWLLRQDALDPTAARLSRAATGRQQPRVGGRAPRLFANVA